VENLLGRGLADLSHEKLYLMRLASDLDINKLLAPFEHRAFAREWVRENPWLAVPSLAFSIPGYQLSKMLRLRGEGTGASLDQLFAGYQGLFEGLK
jgi:hypothetical protein